MRLNGVGGRRGRAYEMAFALLASAVAIFVQPFLIGGGGPPASPVRLLRNGEDHGESDAPSRCSGQRSVPQ